MKTAVTSGVKVSVETVYEDDLSNPANHLFIHSYFIHIENQNDFEVQLLRRHWEVKDSLNSDRIVDGEGVVGRQPVIRSGEFYTYESSCNLTSDIGSMRGYYLFKRTDTGQPFKVEIPEFRLEIPYRLN